MEDKIYDVAHRLAESIYELLIIEISNHTGLKRRKVRKVIEGRSKSIRDIYQVAHAVGVNAEVSYDLTKKNGKDNGKGKGKVKAEKSIPLSTR